MKDIMLHKNCACFLRILFRGENGCNGDEYSYQLDFSFIEFIEYGCHNEDQVKGHVSQMTKQKTARDQDVSGSNESRHYGKVYVRRNRVDRTIDYQETNLNPPAFQNSLNDLNIMVIKEVSESCHDVSHEEMIVGQHTNNK